MVLVTRADKRRVYLHLLQEGVIVLKKDYTMEKHKDTGVANLFVWMLLRSLKDKDMVELVFNWQYFYYYIKTDGVDFLRKQVGILDDKIVPVTFKQNKKQLLMQNEDENDVNRPRRGGFGGRGGRFGGRGGRREFGDRREGGDQAPQEGEQGGAPGGGYERPAGGYDRPRGGYDRPRGDRFGGAGGAGGPRRREADNAGAPAGGAAGGE